MFWSTVLGQWQCQYLKAMHCNKGFKVDELKIGNIFFQGSHSAKKMMDWQKHFNVQFSGTFSSNFLLWPRLSFSHYLTLTWQHWNACRHVASKHWFAYNHWVRTGMLMPETVFRGGIRLLQQKCSLTLELLVLQFKSIMTLITWTWLVSAIGKYTVSCLLRGYSDKSSTGSLHSSDSGGSCERKWWNYTQVFHLTGSGLDGWIMKFQ